MCVCVCVCIHALFLFSCFSLQMRAKSYPATYPNGWYHIVDSDAVAVGQVVEAHACGKVFAVFRGENGHAAILDAYCVHLGANMAIGGKVVNNCLVCQRGEGVCVCVCVCVHTVEEI